jgi:hypothetical protein
VVNEVTVELTIVDRLLLGNLLSPVAGNMVTLRIVRGLQETLSFGEEEKAELGLRQEGDQVKWNQDAQVSKEFTFKAGAVEVIQQELKKADAVGQLTLDHVDLFDKFCPEEEINATPSV